MYICIYMYVYTCMCIYTYIYIYTQQRAPALVAGGARRQVLGVEAGARGAGLLLMAMSIVSLYTYIYISYHTIMYVCMYIYIYIAMYLLVLLYGIISSMRLLSGLAVRGDRGLLLILAEVTLHKYHTTIIYTVYIHMLYNSINKHSI